VQPETVIRWHRQTFKRRLALYRAIHHQGGRNQYSLLRVFADGAEPRGIRAEGSKLKKLTEVYDGGGSQFRKLSSGSFVFIEHINSAFRRHGRDPVTLSAPGFGSVKLLIDVPPQGKLGVVGDIVLRQE